MKRKEIIVNTIMYLIAIATIAVAAMGLYVNLEDNPKGLEIILCLLMGSAGFNMIKRIKGGNNA